MGREGARGPRPELEVGVHVAAVRHVLGPAARRLGEPTLKSYPTLNEIRHIENLLREKNHQNFNVFKLGKGV